MQQAHITPEEQQCIQAILRQGVPTHKVRAFGSRVHGRQLKPFSDLDLVIMSKTPLNSKTLSALQDAFSDYDLPFRVDIIDWASTAPYFQELIIKDSEELI